MQKFTPGPLAEVGGYLGHGMKTVVSLDDIRSALTSARGDQS